MHAEAILPSKSQPSPASLSSVVWLWASLSIVLGLNLAIGRKVKKIRPREET